MTTCVTTSASSTVFLCRVLFVLLCFCSRNVQGQLCQICAGNVRHDSPVWNYCLSRGNINGRCCMENISNSVNTIIGLDLGNCSLDHLEHLYNASTAVIIDLTYNPLFNLSDLIFKGFHSLSELFLPMNVDCPGGSASWEKQETSNNVKVCKGQKNVCNQTGQMTWICPENSFCSPNGPGFLQCTCLNDFYGYKCMRQGVFPTQKVLVILTAATLVLSTLLWFIQRRKVEGS